MQTLYNAAINKTETTALILAVIAVGAGVIWLLDILGGFQRVKLFDNFSKGESVLYWLSFAALAAVAVWSGFSV